MCRNAYLGNLKDILWSQVYFLWSYELNEPESKKKLKNFMITGLPKWANSALCVWGGGVGPEAK